MFKSSSLKCDMVKCVTALNPYAVNTTASVCKRAKVFDIRWELLKREVDFQ